MRLNSFQIQSIKQVVAHIAGPSARVWLFGSRVRDDIRGGDIDLMVETNSRIENRAQMVCRLVGSLTMALGDRKLDVVLKDSRTTESAVIRIAQRDGVLL